MEIVKASHHAASLIFFFPHFNCFWCEGKKNKNPHQEPLRTRAGFQPQTHGTLLNKPMVSFPLFAACPAVAWREKQHDYINRGNQSGLLKWMIFLVFMARNHKPYPRTCECDNPTNTQFACYNYCQLCIQAVRLLLIETSYIRVEQIDRLSGMSCAWSLYRRRGVKSVTLWAGWLLLWTFTVEDKRLKDAKNYNRHQQLWRIINACFVSHLCSLIFILSGRTCIEPEYKSLPHLKDSSVCPLPAPERQESN